MSSHLPQLAGEVLVCASIFGSAEGWLQQSPARLKIWQALAGLNSRRGNATHVRGQLSSLPFATGAVDALVVQHGFEVASDWRASLGESARVVREGGRVLVLVLDAGLRVRSMLARLPKMSFIEPFVIRGARHLPALYLKLAFARHGLECERDTRAEGSSARARLLIFRNRQGVGDLQTHRQAERAPEQAGLVPASRISGALR